MSWTLGCSTKTGWNRRSSAASFSMCLRYSSSVVAPMSAELPAGEHRLDHVAGVHRPFGGTCPDDRVELVDEGDDLALRIGDLLQYRLQPLLEFAAVLCTRDHRRQVEADDPLAAEALWDVAVDDPLRESFDDRRLADAGLTDEHRIVLGPAVEHLDDPADLLVTADDRVELALVRELGEVAAVALESEVLVLGVCDVTRWLPRTSRMRRATCRGSPPIRSDIDSSRCSTERYSSPMSERRASAASRMSRLWRERVGSLVPYAFGWEAMLLSNA